ncbi:Hop1 meiosis-specific axial element protein [Guillardia theta CCMP2712]|uniref:Hop1 meiosis-specific axial element protein n=1 Tax=Guillardia theta (strain CCMP2712) TaxID=905079 RepID=L1J2G4_GUITC|nr:Hop1 meiosis-specific axial element protein [Guillardia theta CCMP2712]EKX42507.1 Hop1 meiosis-specific axial element protein [Guillardia theta CCMP2712]|eukprot:XP_005829487.1 Hop1 meiosis-specific axial element protein [Guillardia theta CCMP2712]
MATATASAVTMRESQAVMQNLLSASMCEIFYSRKLLPKDCFESVKFAGNTLHRFKNNLENPKADTLYRWIKEDVVDALKKKILHRLVLGIFLSPECAEKDLIESYTFSFGYDGDNCSLDIETQRHKNKNAKDLPGHESIKQNTQILVRSLIAMLGTLDELPQKYFLSIRMHYYHNEEYETFTPHNFRMDPSTEDFYGDSSNDLQIGGFNTGFHSVAVKYIFQHCYDFFDLTL